MVTNLYLGTIKSKLPMLFTYRSKVLVTEIDKVDTGTIYGQ
jgi:hypothetical protein